MCAQIQNLGLTVQILILPHNAAQFNLSCAHPLYSNSFLVLFLSFVQCYVKEMNLDIRKLGKGKAPNAEWSCEKRTWPGRLADPQGYTFLKPFFHGPGDRLILKVNVSPVCSARFPFVLRT